MKRIGLMLSILVLISSTYVIAEVIRFSGSNPNTNQNSVIILSDNRSITDDPNFGEWIIIQANVTDDGDIWWVNFTLTASNSSEVINNSNATAQGSDIFNSSAFRINRNETWTYNVTSSDLNLTINNSIPYADGSFSITDKLYKSHNDIKIIMDRKNNSLPNITFWTSSREMLNFTFNSSMDVGRSNISISVNTTNITMNSTQDAYILEVNITTNSSTVYGNWSGNITILRNAPFPRLWIIPINITIDSNFGDIEFVEPVDYTLSSCPATLSHSIVVRNNGNYELTGCHPKFEVDGVEVSTTTEFDLAAGASTNASAYYAYPGTSVAISYFKVECASSTAAGSPDETINNPKITFLPASGCTGGGAAAKGGGGGTIISEPKVLPPPDEGEKEVGLCGDNICAPNENPWTCPEDCLSQIWEFDKIFCMPLLSCGNWETSWFINIMIVAVLGGLLFFNIQKGKIRRPI